MKLSKTLKLLLERESPANKVDAARLIEQIDSAKLLIMQKFADMAKHELYVILSGLASDAQRRRARDRLCAIRDLCKVLNSERLYMESLLAGVLDLTEEEITSFD